MIKLNTFGSLCENCQEDVRKDFCSKCNQFVCLNRKCLKDHNGHFIIYFETIVQHHSSIQLHEFFYNSIEALKTLKVKINNAIDNALSEINSELQTIDTGKNEFEKNANDQKLSDQTLQLINQASSTPCFKAEFSKLAEDYSQKEQIIKSRVSKLLTGLVDEYMCNNSNTLTSTDNKFIHYALSDTNIIYIYYPTVKKLMKMTLKDHLPTDFDSVEINGNIYFMGGYKGNIPIADNSMLRFETSSLLPKEPMLVAKYYHTLCRFGNKYIFSVGGYDYSKSIDDCERYNVKDNTWAKMPNLLRPTNEPAACIFREKYLYSVCGYDSVMSMYLDLVQRIDIAKNDKWEKIVISLPSRLGAYSVALDECTILLFGGYNGTYYNNSVIIMVNDEDKHSCGSMHPLTMSGEYFYKSSSVMTIQKRIYAISSNQNLFTFNTTERKWSCMMKKDWQSL